MAKAKQQVADEDVAVDRYGRPLPLVVMRDKAGVEVEVRDSAGLSLMHYGYGMEFAEDGMTYTKAMQTLLHEDHPTVLAEVPPEGGDIDWHLENAPGEKVAASDDLATDKGKASDKSD